MPKIKGFDVPAIAQELASYHANLISNDMGDQFKQYLGQKLYQLVLKAGEAIEALNINIKLEQAQAIIQMLSAHAYHTTLELSQTEIPSKYWDKIIQDVAIGVFKMSQNLVQVGMDIIESADMIRQEAKSHFVHSVETLYTQGIITDEVRKKAFEIKRKGVPEESQPAEGAGIKKDTPRDSHHNSQELSTDTKLQKYAAIALILTSMPESKIANILSQFKPDEVSIIKKLMDEGVHKQMNSYNVKLLLDSLNQTIYTGELEGEYAKSLYDLLNKKNNDKFLASVIQEREAVNEYVISIMNGKQPKVKFSPSIEKIMFKHFCHLLNPANPP